MCSTFLVGCVAKYPRTASAAVSAMGMVWLMICPFSGSDYSLRQLKKIIAINWQSTMFIKLWQQAFRIQHLSKSQIATKNPESYVAFNTVSLNATLVGTISTASIGTGRSAPISLATSMSPGCQQTYVTHDEKWFELQKQGSVGDPCALVDSRPVLPSEDAISEADHQQAKRNPIRIVGFIMGAPSKLSR